MPTTAGSLALAGNITHRDAPVVARLRAAGAVILGKTNLSEWANIRTTHSISGWSGVGGLVKNPYVLDRSACGSVVRQRRRGRRQPGAAALGTETNGSLVCPGSFNGMVALEADGGPGVAHPCRTDLPHPGHAPGRWRARSPMPPCCWTPWRAATRPMPPPPPPMPTGVRLCGALWRRRADRQAAGRDRAARMLTPIDKLFADALANIAAAGAEIVQIPDFSGPRTWAQNRGHRSEYRTEE